MHNTTSAFSRSAESDPRGKCVERIDIPVPESVKEDAVFVARANGKTVSEWARGVITKELYGAVDHIQKIMQDAPLDDGTKTR